MKETFLEYDVDIRSCEHIAEAVINAKKGFVVSCLNAHAFCTAERNEDFKNALVDTDILVPDGAGIVFGLRFLYQKKIKRVTGSDVHDAILQELNDRGGSIMYMGSTDKVLLDLCAKVKDRYPSIKEIHTYSPPFSSEFTVQELSAMVEGILNSQTKYVFLGLTAPKQELLALKLRSHCPNISFMNVGAVFDFFSENIPRAPKFMRDNGLEWLHRSFQHPSKLGVRNIQSNPKFIAKILYIKIRLMLNKVFKNDPL